jgi:hypothetical protein
MSIPARIASRSSDPRLGKQESNRTNNYLPARQSTCLRVQAVLVSHFNPYRSGLLNPTPPPSGVDRVEHEGCDDKTLQTTAAGLAGRQATSTC